MVLLRVGLFVTFSILHHRRHSRRHPKELSAKPLVSVIVPAYNEGPTLENCIRSLFKQTYTKFEVIIVNDGSTDDTEQIAWRLRDKYGEKIRVYSQPNGGKASALNLGVDKAAGEVVVCMDADSMFLKDAVRQLVLSLHDPEVAAVGGNVRVANQRRLLGMHQAIEYITGLAIQRCAFAHIGCMQVISGAIGAFRKDALKEVGGYSKDTIVEDMDVTITLARAGYKIAYNKHAVAYTEAPESLRAFIKQRYRWVYGGFQVAAKHQDLFLKRHNRRMGTIGIPYFMIFPWVDVVVSAILLYGYAAVAMGGNPRGLIEFYIPLTAMQIALMLYALYLDKQSKWLSLLAFVYGLFYSFVISYVTVKAGINYLRGRGPTWNKLQRYGKNALPEGAHD
ncbi:MAG TPA: glycosyltransferase family 2 protein [Candidatus Saccharimonadales bacterium]|nr:glycosyltransferase family 2 protein [Candidatus Saccharimonadales bacterium]